MIATHCTYTSNTPVPAGNLYKLNNIQYTDTKWVAGVVEWTPTQTSVPTEILDYLNTKLDSYWLWSFDAFNQSFFVTLSPNQINSMSISIDNVENFVLFSQSACFDLPLRGSETAQLVKPFFNAEDLMQVSLFHIYISSTILVFFTIYLIISKSIWKN